MKSSWYVPADQGYDESGRSQALRAGLTEAETDESGEPTPEFWDRLTDEEEPAGTMELHNHEWDAVAGELEWMGDEALELANKIYDSMDDDGAVTMTIANLTEAEQAMVRGVLQLIENAKPVGMEIEAGDDRAEHEAATMAARTAVAVAKEASAKASDTPTRSNIREIAALWTAADEAWGKAEQAGLRRGGA